MHWGLPAFGSIREPGGAHAEVALALLAAARTSRARARTANPTKVPIKAENKRFLFLHSKPDGATVAPRLFSCLL